MHNFQLKKNRTIIKGNSKIIMRLLKKYPKQFPTLSSALQLFRVPGERGLPKTGRAIMKE